MLKLCPLYHRQAGYSSAMGPPGTVKQSIECDTRVARIDTSDERTVEDSIGSFGGSGFHVLCMRACGYSGQQKLHN